MSYDLRLKDPVSKETIKIEEPHHMHGGTYAIGGTNELSLNITYNYSKYYYKVFGKEGIRTIYGKTGLEAMSILDSAISQLSDEIDETIGTQQKVTQRGRCYSF